MAGVVLAGLLPAGPAAASVTLTIRLATTSTFKESAGVDFTCPWNQVLTGRAHKGDENGYTTYYCSRVLFNGEEAQVTVGDWSLGQREDYSTYQAPWNHVLVGRWHTGDEKGITRYRPGTMTWRGRQVYIDMHTWTGPMRESSHASHADVDQRQIMTGRIHSGNENGDTKYQYGKIFLYG
ncbi:hypothetical protein D5H75_09450 [Bailinhaonella thermotolerans]|uniref:Uncharacterized protein n=2 Tax=Bailinhaonella thermotolerans TaxID=1070861 RepID=A0A3A4BPK3_9ACTN|nr:hypothetical protein D5H75_09450 [Bailinhaonella thermotolerans]